MGDRNMMIFFKLSVLLILISSMNSALAFTNIFGMWRDTCDMPRASCAAHLAAGCTSTKNYQVIISGSIYNVNCEQTQDGGGWMRVNASLVSSGPSFGTNDVISGTNQGQNCGGALNNFILTGLPAHTQARYQLVRTTTIIQCEEVREMSGKSVWYWNGSTWVGYGSCSWSYPWAEASPNVSATGPNIKNTWKMIGNHTSSTYSWTTGCGTATDNGIYNVQVWIK
jgi:hypothetical protein